MDPQMTLHKQHAAKNIRLHYVLTAYMDAVIQTRDAPMTFSQYSDNQYKNNIITKVVQYGDESVGLFC